MIGQTKKKEAPFRQPLWSKYATSIFCNDLSYISYAGLIVMKKTKRKT